jgi:hypothetical protein
MINDGVDTVRLGGGTDRKRVKTCSDVMELLLHRRQLSMRKAHTLQKKLYSVFCYL